MNENKVGWKQYYEKVASRPHHKRTERALKLNASGLDVAVDCGCGVGSDIDFLDKKGFTVFGFDTSADAIAICSRRFGTKSTISLANQSFESFTFPQAGVIIANHSLFFADPKTFNSTMQNIQSALAVGGVFAGDFLGHKDSWANKPTMHTSLVTEKELRALFSEFDIIEFTETDERGKVALGGEKHWHFYSLLAVKRA